ncbi:MAG TPA: hypothetical protein VLS85_07610, partial [Hanamia sp.]|nr:hypothetical protein [Hanamia sp.]
FMKDDYRPPFILDDVKGAILYDVQAQKNARVASIILKNDKDINLKEIDGVKNTSIKNVIKKEL